MLAVTVVGMVAAASAKRIGFSLAMVALFSIALILVGLWSNWVHWQPKPTGSHQGAAVMASRRNASLIAFGYAWGGIAMGSVYSLSGLRWRHGWQYALAMMLMAWLVMDLAHRLSRPGSIWQRPVGSQIVAAITALQGVMALVGIAWLTMSGKLDSVRSDWAANHIFLAGGLTIAVLSAIALRTHATLAAESSPARETGSGGETQG
jgi:hypothetical protein